MPTIQQHISSQLAKRIPGFKCLAMFDYGSRVYGYKTPDDYDLIVVIKHNIDRDEMHHFYDQITFGEYNITVMCENRYYELRAEHEISILECMNLPENHILWIDSLFKEKYKKFDISLPLLRSAIAKKSSNSYVKAKKKLIIEADMDLECSIKSLFHSLRILQFGCQLASTGKITNFAESNGFYVKIIQEYIDSKQDWEEIHKVMKLVHNELSSKFKLLAPKKVI